MDSFGYRNWNDSTSPSYMDSSGDYDYGVSSKDQLQKRRSTVGPTVAKGGQIKSYGNSDTAYDFEISNDDFDASPDYQTSSKSTKDRRSSAAAATSSAGSSTRFGGMVRRSSVDDRTREILERNKKIDKSAAVDTVGEERFKSYQSTYAELMEGLELPDSKKDLTTQQTPTGTPRGTKSPAFAFKSPRSNSSIDSPMDTADSFEISAADLEVGAIAARRAKEKASDRRKRMSLDRAPHEQNDPKRTSSPDISRMGALSPSGSHNMHGLQFSAALSSIHRSQGGALAGVMGGGGTAASVGAAAAGDSRRFGSSERSDEDIYKMLNVTTGTDASLQFGGTDSKISDAPLVSSREESGRATSRSRDEVHYVANRSLNYTPLGGQESYNAAGTRSQQQQLVGAGTNSSNVPRRRSLTEMSDVTSGSEGNNDLDEQRPLTTTAAAALRGRLPSVGSGKGYYQKKSDDDNSGGDSDNARSPSDSKKLTAGSSFTSAAKASVAVSTARQQKQQETKTAVPVKKIDDDDEDDNYDDDAEEEDEDEYSLDDFEQDQHASSANSPEKATTHISPTQQQQAVAAATLAPTASTGALTTVEEIMQRWHSDSDFMRQSVIREPSGANIAKDKYPSVVRDSSASIASNEDIEPRRQVPLISSAAAISRMGDSPSPSPTAGEIDSNPTNSDTAVRTNTAAVTTTTLRTAAAATGEGIAIMYSAGDGEQSASVGTPVGLHLLNAVGTASMVTSIPPPAPQLIAEARSVATNAAGSKPSLTFSQSSTGKPSFPPDNKASENIFEISDSFSDFPESNTGAAPSSAATFSALVKPAAVAANATIAAPAPVAAVAAIVQAPKRANSESKSAYMSLDQLPIHELDDHGQLKDTFTHAPPPPNPPKLISDARESSNSAPVSKPVSIAAAFRYMPDDSRQQQQDDSDRDDDCNNRGSNSDSDSDDNRENFPQSLETNQSNFPLRASGSGGGLRRSSGASPPRRATVAASEWRSSGASTSSRRRNKHPTTFDIDYGRSSVKDINKATIKMAPSTSEKLKQKQQLRGRRRTLQSDVEQLAAKVGPRRSTSTSSRGVAASLHTQSTAARDRQLQTKAAAVAALHESAKQREALVTAKQDNWRLSKKFERLEREIQDMRAGQLSSGGFDDSLRISAATATAAGGTASSLVKRGRQELGASAEGRQNSSRSRSAPRRSVGATDVTMSMQAASSAAAAGGSSFVGNDVDDNWAAHIQDAMQRLARENAKLLEKEKALMVREEAVALREVAVESRERMLATTRAGAQQASSLKSDIEKSTMKDALLATTQRNNLLEQEISRLKALLFEQKQNHDLTTEEQHARESIELRSQLDIAEESYKQLLLKRNNDPAVARKLSSTTTTTTPVAAVVGEGVSESMPKTPITVNKEDYERLLKDHAELETLVEGFQRENEKLSKLLKEQHTEHQVRSALYFDERTQMNKELNRMRNMLRSGTGQSFNLDDINPMFPNNNIGGGVGSGSSLPFDEVPVSGGLQAHKSAEVLRAELQFDATVRILKEKLAEAESGSSRRERDMQSTIEKLRKENRELAGLAANVNAAIISGNKADTDFLQMQAENSALAAELSQLKGKLSWYIQNQKLLDAAEEERRQWHAAAQALQKELLGKRGVERKDVDRIVQLAMQNPQQQQRSPSSKLTATAATVTAVGGRSDTSLLVDKSTASSVRNGLRQPRSFADIKKIKELEGIIRDLQESLSKRHPDSVANLIRAAAVGGAADGEQVRVQKQQQARMQELQSEMSEMKQLHERRLRSLRQEHDRVRERYESLITELENQLKLKKASSPATASVGAAVMDGGEVVNRMGSSQGGTIRNLGQALSRISDLETELERVRTFYKRKVEEVQRKSEAQIRAFKRGDVPTAGAGAATTAATSTGVAAGADWDRIVALAADSSPAQQQQQQLHAEQLEEVQQLTDHYTERISMLEKELMATAEELGRVKANSSTTTAASDPPPPPPPYQTTTAATAELVRHEREQLESLHNQRLRDLRDAHRDHVEQLQQQWRSEREGLLNRIKDEQERYSQLLHSTNASQQQQQQQQYAVPRVEVMKSPEMSHFQLMEQQISQLEQRLQRREKELAAAVDDARAAQKMERARLEALHAQECREKDEQLVRFQMELEQLVYALRQWQYGATVAAAAADAQQMINAPSALGSGTVLTES